MKKNLLYGLQKKNGSMVTHGELYGAVDNDYDIREKLLDLDSPLLSTEKKLRSLMKTPEFEYAIPGSVEIVPVQVMVR
jgi:hypothetical protein